MRNTQSLQYSREGRGGKALAIETLFVPSVVLGFCNSAYAATIKVAR